MQYLTPSTEAELLAVYGPERLDALLALAVPYLDAGVLVVRGFGTFEHPALDGPQPIGQATDGEWVWPLVAARLFEARAAWPPAAFLDHVAVSKVPPAELDDATKAEAVEVAKQG